MPRTYEDLFSLLEGEPLARRYFENMPDHVRLRLARRAGSIQSVALLKRWAEENPSGEG